MKLKYKIEVNQLGDQYIGVAIGEDAIKYKNILFTNKIGFEILKCLKNEITIDGIVENVVNNFDGQSERIIKEIEEFIEKLIDLDLIDNNDKRGNI